MQYEGIPQRRTSVQPHNIFDPIRGMFRLQAQKIDRRVFPHGITTHHSVSDPPSKARVETPPIGPHFSVPHEHENSSRATLGGLQIRKCPLPHRKSWTQSAVAFRRGEADGQILAEMHKQKIVRSNPSEIHVHVQEWIHRERQGPRVAQLHEHAGGKKATQKQHHLFPSHSDRSISTVLLRVHGRRRSSQAETWFVQGIQERAVPTHPAIGASVIPG